MDKEEKKSEKNPKEAEVGKKESNKKGFPEDLDFKKLLGCGS